jgi:hypothetical protein
MAETFEIDPPLVTRDEATELCVHHMMLAAAYFEVSPDDENKSINQEILRITERNNDLREQIYLRFTQELFLFHEAQKERD